MRMIKDDRKKISEDTNGMSMTYFQKQKKKERKDGDNIKRQTVYVLMDFYFRFRATHVGERTRGSTHQKIKIRHQ